MYLFLKHGTLLKIALKFKKKKKTGKILVYYTLKCHSEY